VSGLFVHIGLLWLNPIYVAIGILLLPAGNATLRKVFCFSLSILIDIYYYAPAYYAALVQTQENPYQIIVGLGVAFIMAWVVWSYIFMMCSSVSWYYILPTSWLVYSHKIWELVGIGFYDISPIIMHTPFEGLVSVMGQGAIWLVIWSLFALRHRRLRYVILVLVFIAPVASYQESDHWLDEIHIYGESQKAGEVKGNAIISKRMYEKNNIYHASIGIGDVVGVSIKRHLVPYIESGYQTKIINRQFTYNQHKFLVLICNDALYTDWMGTDNSEAVVVVTHLSDLEGTPLIAHFAKKLRFVSLLKSLPILHVDQDFTEYYSFT